MDKDEHGKQSEQIVSMQKSGYLVFLMELALFGIRSINPGFRLANIKSKFDLSTTTNRKQFTEGIKTPLFKNRTTYISKSLTDKNEC